MTGANMGHLYYREYYRGFTDEDWKKLVNEDKPGLSVQADEHIKKINRMISDANMEDFSSLKKLCSMETKNLYSFDLKTTYPGLLTGIGWEHSAGNIDDEFKMGFYFDHTTGLPVIPGSTIKGVLRNAFLNSEYIKGLLQGLDADILNAANLMVEIFEGRDGNGPIPLIKRDIFLDAYIAGSENSKGKFLAEDFITPHKDEYTNPIPIKFLKVLPGVTFRFQFDLKDNGIKANRKCFLFKKILLDLGIGAMTNVGYGQFAADASDKATEKRLIEEEKSRKKKEKQKRLDEMPPVDRAFVQYNNDKNAIINALGKNELELDSSQRIEVAERIKSIMLEEKIWLRPKKPKDKKRVSFIQAILKDRP